MAVLGPPNVDVVNAVLPKGLHMYHSLTEADDVIGILPKRQYRLTDKNLTHEAQRLITHIRRKSLARRQAHILSPLRTENKNFGDTVAHLERKIADLEEEKAHLQMMVEQLHYQKSGLLRLCDEKLHQQRAALNMLTSGVASVGEGHYPYDSQRSTRSGAQ